MVTKKFFVSLSILILGKESPTAENIDVFLKPLYEEMHELWEGAATIDARPVQETRSFCLRSLLLWTVSDFLAYGLISRQ